jgi:uncharacterized membrane protein YqjE
MEPPSHPASGLVQSLRALGDSALGAVQERLQLFSIELQEEKVRLIQLFIWISAAVLTGMLVITFASLTLVYLLWESARLVALGGLTLLYGSALVVIILLLRRQIARQSKPFAATLHELKEDRACFRTGN